MSEMYSDGIPEGSVVISEVRLARYIPPNGEHVVFTLDISRCESSYDAHALIAMGLTTLASKPIYDMMIDAEEDD